MIILWLVSKAMSLHSILWNVIFLVKARILTSFNQVAVNFLNQIYNIFRERDNFRERDRERERGLHWDSDQPGVMLLIPLLRANKAYREIVSSKWLLAFLHVPPKKSHSTPLPLPRPVEFFDVKYNWLKKLHKSWVVSIGNFSLSFCSFLYNGVCFGRLKLSLDDVIVSQKGSNGDGRQQFFGGDYNSTRTICAKIPHIFNEA